MRRKRVNLRDSSHRGDKARADRASWTDQVALRVAPADNFRREPVNDREAVFDDTFQLCFLALLNLFRERIRGDFFGSLIR